MSVLILQQQRWQQPIITSFFFFVVVIREKVRTQGVSSRESGPLFYICAKVVASQKIGIAFFCMVRQAFSGNTYIWLLLVSRFIIIVILYFCVRNEMWLSHGRSGVRHWIVYLARSQPKLFAADASPMWTAAVKVIQHLLPPPSSGVVCVPGALGIETGGGNQRDCLWLDVIRLVFPLLRLLWNMHAQTCARGGFLIVEDRKWCRPGEQVVENHIIVVTAGPLFTVLKVESYIALSKTSCRSFQRLLRIQR